MDDIGSKLFSTAKVVSKNEISNYGELGWQRNVKFNDSYILNTIYDWEPQDSYDGYNPDKMYTMDYVAKVVLESDYKLVAKTLKEFAITVVSLASYWYANNFNNKKYILDSEEQVRQLIGTNFSSFDNRHWAELFNTEKDNILQLYI